MLQVRTATQHNTAELLSSGLCCLSKQHLAKFRKHSWQVSKQLKTQTTQQLPVPTHLTDYCVSANNNTTVRLIIEMCCRGNSAAQKRELTTCRTFKVKVNKRNPQQHGQ